VRSSSRRDFVETIAAEWAIGDVLDPSGLDAALNGVDGVVHCAGITKALSREQYFHVNHLGTRNLLEACARRIPSIQRIVYISSLAAFGPARAGEPVTELSTPHPVSAYGDSKLAAHLEAQAMNSRLPVRIIIPSAVYGPNDVDFLVYFKFVRHGIMPLIGRTPRRVSVIHAADLAEAVSQALLDDRAAGKSYFVEDGAVQTWAGVASSIGKAMARRPVRICIPSIAARGLGTLGGLFARCTGRAALIDSEKIRDFLQESWTCSSRRIREELNFRPNYSFDEGIHKTLEWYRAHGWL
jgi:nucleoside-diphosphate-sugar epimerase